MAQIYTHEFLQNLQSNLKNFTSKNSKDFTSENPEATENKNYDDHYFQILIFDGDINNLDQDDFNLKLVYGTKEAFRSYYNHDNDSTLPTTGVKVSEEFMPSSTGNSELDEIYKAQYSTVRFLLQSRKLSQVTACTWLDDKRQEDISPNTEKKLNLIQKKLIRKIYEQYNIKPQLKLEPYKLVQVNNRSSQDPEFKEEPINSKEINRQFEQDKNGKGDFLIKLSSISYNSIALALLLAGQAYYKNGKDEEGNDKYKIICKSIFSTYEMIWEYGIDLSWDTFYARREDISQSGLYPNPPFTKVILAYPPRPHNSSLSQNQIRQWVEAEDEWGEDGEESQFPFYPQHYENKKDGNKSLKETEDWQNKQLQYIVPPYPYIPLSCM